MGCTQSKHTKAMKKRHKDLQNQLKKQDEKKDNEHLILLLGSGESGKSTIMKQMKVIYGRGFSEEEYKAYITIIHENIYGALFIVFDAMTFLEVPLEDQELEEFASKFLTITYTYLDLPTNWHLVKKALENQNFQSVLDRSSEYYLNDSAKYFFSSLDRIIEPGYIPTTEDIMKSRAKTTAVVKSTFEVDDIKINMIDIGGQKCERRKWLGYFDGMTAMIFVVALSEYDLKMEEDPEMMRGQDTLAVFKSIVEITSQPIIVFLNKYDIFEAKLSKSPMKDYWTDYEGGDDVNKAIEFMQDKFRSQVKDPKRDVYFKVTTATDTENLKFILKFVVEKLTEANMMECGFS